VAQRQVQQVQASASDLFSLLRLPYLLDFAALLFDFLLLLGNLFLGLLLLGVLILHRIPHGQPAQGADASANHRAGGRMSDSGTNNRSSAGAQNAATQGTLCERRDRLTIACDRGEHNGADR